MILDRGAQADQDCKTQQRLNEQGRAVLAASEGASFGMRGMVVNGTNYSETQVSLSKG